MKKILRIAAFMYLLGFFSSALVAQDPPAPDIIVKPNPVPNTNEYATITEALDNAMDDDIIEIHEKLPGGYVLYDANGGEPQRLAIQRPHPTLPNQHIALNNVTIRGKEGHDVIIDGNFPVAVTVTKINGEDHDPRHAIKVPPSNNVRFENITIRNSLESGIWVIGGSGHKFDNVKFVDNYTRGFYATDSADLTFENCTFQGTKPTTFSKM